MEKKPVTIENKSLYRTLAMVALPIALQSLISSSLSLVDNLMVGSLGETELAATGLGTQFYYIHWMILFGFCSGCATFMSQFWGAGDVKSIRKTIGFAVLVCTSFSLVFFMAAAFFPYHVLRMFTNLPEVMDFGASYIRTASVGFLCTCIIVPFTTALRATQQASLPLKISATAFVANTALNYIFIFGKFGAPALGVQGAALGTAVSRLIELTLCLFFVFGKRNLLSGKISEFFGWTRGFVLRLVSNTIPTTVNESLWGVGQSTYNGIYGRIGVTESAAVLASNTINNLFILAIFSLGDAMLILVGQQLGKGEAEYAYELSKKILKIALKVGFVTGLLLILSSRPIISLYGFTPEGARFAVLILTIYGAAIPLRVYGGLHITGTLRAGGDTKYAMFSELSCLWLIGVPAAYIGGLILNLPIHLVVLLTETEGLVKCFILHQRYISKKWLNNVIHDIK